MNIFYPFVLVVHVLFALSLIVAVLLQSAKGEGLAGAFGGGGGLSGAVFGGRGAATFLSKATSFIAIGFMLTSLTLFVSLGITSSGGEESGVVRDLQEGPSDLAPSPPPSTVPGEIPGGEEAGPGDLFQQPPPAQDTSGR
jgi:preprotein translocase subunit SecG